MYFILFLTTEWIQIKFGTDYSLANHISRFIRATWAKVLAEASDQQPLLGFPNETKISISVSGLNYTSLQLSLLAGERCLRTSVFIQYLAFRPADNFDLLLFNSHSIMLN